MKPITIFLLTFGMAGAPAFAQSSLPASDMPDGGNTGRQAAQPDTSSGAGTEGEAGLEQAPAASAHPQPQTKGDITYVCGGIGQEEASYMKQAAHDYDLMLTFATRDGDYLADVRVDIQDARGTPVLQTGCSGPLMLVDLPRSGTYRVRAEAGGHVLNQTAVVHAGRRKSSVAAVVLSWPQQVAETGAPQTSGESAPAEDDDDTN